MSKPDYVLEANPKRPYKMYAAILAGALGALLVYSDVLPLWLVIAVNSILGGLAVYLVPNPLQLKNKGVSPTAYAGDTPLF